MQKLSGFLDSDAETTVHLALVHICLGTVVKKEARADDCNSFKMSNINYE